MGNKKEKFVIVYRCLWRSDSFKFLGYPSKVLFISMKESMFDEHNGYAMDEMRVPFGPQDAEGYGMNKRTYYRALKELIDIGIIAEVSSGSHGKKAVYDLTAWKKGVFEEERQCVAPLKLVGIS